MKVNYKKECLEMWDWLVRNPDKEKIDYFYLHPEKETPINKCYACQYDEDNMKEGDKDCSHCPITWNILNKEDDHCGSENSPYHKWRTEIYDEDRRFWALKIYTIIKNTWKEKKNEYKN